jgi:bifunctional enzyme CysN/CysC
MSAVIAFAQDAERIDGVALRARLDVRPGRKPDASARATSLSVLTCGSVDDGKSTLIGRLLWDTDGLHADQRATLERSPRTAAGTPDFSLLVDGLAAEREQGITIDIAWRYLDTSHHRLVVIDSPGHEQYTRNMATGASHADVAILLVDARGGVKEQTRRHAAILNLMGVRKVVLAVNKMDLVGWSQERFAEIHGAFETLARRLGFEDAVSIPVSAVLGDNIARRSAATPWYRGRTLLDHLGRAAARSVAPSAQFRFPVQLVVRAGQDFRGLAGTITSGSIAAGDEVIEPVSGQRGKVRRIVTMGRDLEAARQGQAVVLELDVDLDISRGAVLARGDSTPAVARELDVKLVWLSDEPFARDRGYLLRTATDLIPIAGLDIRAHLDLAQLTEQPASGCAANDIAIGRIDLSRAAAVDRYADHPATGSFILVDPVSGATVAGGVVVDARDGRTAATKHNVFRLTRDLLARGIGADLPVADARAEQELRRRANEIAILMREAGVAVEVDDAWHRPSGDAATVWLGLLTALSFGFVGAVLFGLV